MGVGRHRRVFRSDQAREVEGAKELLETQRIVGRAKGLLMDRDKMTEADAFSFIQKTAMQHRTKMRTVAQQILDGTLPAG